MGVLNDELVQGVSGLWDVYLQIAFEVCGNTWEAAEEFANEGQKVLIQDYAGPAMLDSLLGEWPAVSFDGLVSASFDSHEAVGQALSETAADAASAVMEVVGQAQTEVEGMRIDYMYMMQEAKSDAQLMRSEGMRGIRASDLISGNVGFDYGDTRKIVKGFGVARGFGRYGFSAARSLSFGRLALMFLI